ncbi:MAG: hypothetical protein FWE03_06555 [Firmicutes bacterium]|nr:hypothetical protein [Bacillota bacterium]
MQKQVIETASMTIQESIMLELAKLAVQINKKAIDIIELIAKTCDENPKNQNNEAN